MSSRARLECMYEVRELSTSAAAGAGSSSLPLSLRPTGETFELGAPHSLSYIHKKEHLEGCPQFE